MRELLAGLASAEQRTGGLFLLVGEPGIGKTRLADELCSIAADRGFATHWGRCWESGGAPAYWPWVQIFTALVNDGTLCLPDTVSCDPVALAPGSSSGESSQPGLVPTTTTAELREARFQTFRGSLALLAQATRRKPMVLVLDDLHAADQSTLLLLQFIARELRGLRLVIIGIHREQDAGLDPDIDSLLARIGREGRALPLRPLGANAVDALVRSRLPHAPDATLTAIFQATHGNPLFLDQVIRTLQVDDGQPPRSCLGDLELPFGLKKAIALHLARLPEEARPVIEIASVLGNEFRTPYLAAVAQMTAGDVDASLCRALSSGVVVQRSRDEYAFSGGLIREALHRGLPGPRREQLHARAAQALCEANREDDRPWAEIAHHHFEAGPTAIDAAVDATIRAAGRALAAMAHEDAFVLLERAQLALQFEPERKRAWANLRLAQAVAHVRSGDAARGRGFYLQALDLARTVGDPDLLARVALAGDIETSAATTPVAIPALAQPTFELRREGEFWSVISAEGVLRLKDSRGLETLDRLLREPDREFHVTELAALAEGPTDLGDAGELLDREARAAYRSRLADLREQVAEAESMGDAGRARRAQDEIDFLAAELARAVGLSGRERRAGNAADRARVTVQKRLRTAIGRIEKGAPSLGRYLSLAVQTGTFCVFRPTRPGHGQRAPRSPRPHA